MRLMTWLRERLYGVEQMARRGRRRVRRFASRPMLRFRPRLEVLEDRCVPAALDPNAFASLGTLNLPGGHGNYYLNTSVTTTHPNPTLQDSNGNVVATGVLYNEGTSTSPNNVAVFDFDSITIGNGNGALTVFANGANPVALLSRTDFTVNGGDINADGNVYSGPGAGGYAGGTAGSPQGKGPGGGSASPSSSGGGGGGGFGGAGGDGSDYYSTATYGVGGASYGDLHNLLQGGSGGGLGEGGSGFYGPAFPGGPGGGAIELGAVGSISIAGVISANGSGGKQETAGSNGLFGDSGGGSGGGIFVHASSVSLTSGYLAANGGYESPSYAGIGGDGGGGRILIQYGAGGFYQPYTRGSYNYSQEFEVFDGDYSPQYGTYSSPLHGAFGVVTIEQVSAPTVTTDPTSQTVTAGSNVSFTAAANGNPTPTVQWQVNTGSGWTPLSDGGNVSGSQTDTLTLTNVAGSMNGYEYRAAFTNSVNGGTTTYSNPATLTVLTNVSSQVQVERSGLGYNRFTDISSGTITITNTGSTALTGELEVVITGLPSGVTLENASGYDANGDPYLLVNIGTLAPGQSVTIAVQFYNPKKLLFNYDVSVFDYPSGG